MYLLDTCVLIWAFEGNQEKLGAFYDTITDESCEIFVSVISYWEIVIKKSLNKLSCPDDVAAMVSKGGFRWLSVDPEHIHALETLPNLHQDPFDRLLVAQSKATSLKLLTQDKKILQYFA
jgi:PIN domain nuclease of toxin-antitoxin system